MREKKYDLLTLGEVLMRLSPPSNERMVRTHTFEQFICGAELNVAAGAAQLGLKTGMIGKIPSNDLGRLAKNSIQSQNISCEYLEMDDSEDSRLGLYFYEGGAAPRKPRIVYDRKNSAMYQLCPDDFPEEMYESTKCFHTCGITLALGKEVREATIEMIKRFKEKGTIISFDVNFRGNLWSGEDAKKYIEEILPYIDIFFCSEDTARLTFLKDGNAKDIMKSFTDDYPVSIVAATKRIVHSPKRHSFGSTIYSKKNDTFYEEESYKDIEVVDRIGSGDAYISGALYGIITSPEDLHHAVSYGNAMSALKNTIPGDFSVVNLQELEEVITSHYNTGLELEMKR